MTLHRVSFPNPAGDALASSADIATLQQQHRFSDAYAAHLRRQNGFRFYALEALPERSRYLHEMSAKPSSLDLAQLYSMDEIAPAQKRIAAIGEWFFSIGKGYGGDQYAEVRCGAHKGAIVHLNKGAFLGTSTFEAFAERYDHFEEFDFTFEESSREEQADFLVASEDLDFATLIASSLEVFLAECICCDAERFTGVCVRAEGARAQQAESEPNQALGMSAERLRPSEGHVKEVGEGDWWPFIQELVDFDFQGVLEEAGEHFIQDQKPAVIIQGDLHIEGDVTSADLAEGKPGYKEDEDREHCTMIVLGNLTVTGHLNIVQNAQLFVTGRVTARTIRGCSANLIAKGAIEARELICFEESEEGGVLYGASIRTPLCVFLGHEFDVPNEIDGEQASTVFAEQHQALTQAAAALTREPRVAYGVFLQVAKLIAAGRALEFVDAYRAERSGEGVQVAVPRATPGAVIPFCESQLKQARATLCGITVDGARIYAAGGLGMSMALVSDDGGRVFREMRVSFGTGLRKFTFDGDALYVCGERGMLARSNDGGATFEPVTTGATICMNTILRGDGALWACGDFGAYQSRDDGQSWSKVDVLGEITRPQDSALGVLLPSDKGHLYIARDGVIQKASLDVGVALWAACATNEGTILAVGSSGAIHRSTDGGKRFQKVASGVITSLENVACTQGGLIVIVGQAGVILRSTDDGAHFERVPQRYTEGWLFGAAAMGDQVLVAGAERLILTVG